MEGRLGRLISRIKPGERKVTHQDLERRIPGYREKMARAAEDFKAGRGVILNPDGTADQVQMRGLELPTEPVILPKMPDVPKGGMNN